MKRYYLVLVLFLLVMAGLAARDLSEERLLQNIIAELYSIEEAYFHYLPRNLARANSNAIEDLIEALKNADFSSTANGNPQRRLIRELRRLEDSYIGYLNFTERRASIKSLDRVIDIIINKYRANNWDRNWNNDLDERWNNGQDNDWDGDWDDYLDDDLDDDWEYHWEYHWGDGTTELDNAFGF